MGAFGLGKELYQSSKQAKGSVRNIFCVGRNFREHAHELGNDVPSKPLIFCKPTHAVVSADGAIQLPPGHNNIHHEVELVLWFHRPHLPGEPVSGSVSAVALGLDLTDRDAQNELKALGQPWELAKGFLNSAVLTDFWRVDNLQVLTNLNFSLVKNGEPVQVGNTNQMIFNFQQLADYVALHFGLGEGDILFTGTPAGVGALHAGDELELLCDGEMWGSLSIEC